ncbi:hypothetical protein Vadar_031380 [Vaccinium darrowii]|uniref:Uncharacterized protein n=1 Tax=Vaccinium darrowii TaxID=229202 RepID=A0ACB7XWB3_9ERIC|nr:hypothetical protein Vadar_031380 [Vaccinium darrowii]
MKEHCMEPFFVFLVFCVGLWCLDEYWYYSLFTLFMLFMFESTMAKSRLKTLTELRRVRVDGDTLMVYRCGKWVKLSGMDLLPGDVVSIGRSTGDNGEDGSVPVDMLLLAGSAIVDEAILTGDLTPVEGFNHGYSSWLCTQKGLEDPTRSKYKLFLSWSLIITSLIPPELPMELSITVNTSLIALAQRGIFCTEPFRIPFAGKVDICCFDKTGTLASGDMEFSGVVGLTDIMELETDMSKVPVRTMEILASCHALVFVDNKLISIGLLWTTTDFIAKGLLYGLKEENGIGSGILDVQFNSKQMEDVNREEEVANSINGFGDQAPLMIIVDRDKLLFSVFSLLQTLGADERPKAATSSKDEWQGKELGTRGGKQFIAIIAVTVG